MKKVFLALFLAFLMFPRVTFADALGRPDPVCDNLGNDQAIAACRECMGNGTNLNGNVWTAIGCIKAGDPNQLISQLLGWAIVLGGGIAFLILVAAGIQMSLAAGDPKKVQAAKDLIMAAISGLVLIVFSLAIIKLLGFNVLGLGQFGFPNP